MSQKRATGVFTIVALHDGKDAPYDVTTYGRSKSRTSHSSSNMDTSYGTNGWGSTAPSPTTTYPYIWRRIQHYNSEGTLTSTSFICDTGIDGTSPLIADLTNEMDSVPMTSGGAVTAQTVLTTTFRIFHGASTTPETLTSLTPSGAATGVTVSCNTSTGVVTVTVAKDTTLTNDKNVITITGVCAKGSRSADFTVAGVRGGANGSPAVMYNLMPSVDVIKKDKNDTLTPASPMTCGVQKVSGTSVTNLTSSQTDGTLRYRVDGDITSSSQGTAVNVGGNVAYANTNSYITFAFFVGTTLRDKERVPILSDGADSTVPGPQGESGYSLIINPEIAIFEETKNASTGDKEVVTTGYEASIKVLKDGVAQSFKIPSRTVSQVNNHATCVFSLKDTNGGTIGTTTAVTEAKFKFTNINTYTEGSGTSQTTNYYDNGYVELEIKTADNKYDATGIRLQFYVNRKETFRREIEDDTEHAFAEAKIYSVNAQGQVVSKTYLFDETIGPQGKVTTLDATVNDPTDGLVHKTAEMSLKVDKISLKVYTENNGNLLPDPIFRDSTFTGTNNPTGLTVVVNTSSSTGGTINAESPYIADGGRVLRIGVSANSATSSTQVYGGGRNVPRVQLAPNKKYTFSVYALITAKTKVEENTIAEYSLWNAETGGSRTGNIFHVALNKKTDAKAGMFEQYAVTFQTGDTYLWFSWIPEFYVKAGKYDFYLAWCGAKLEVGEVATEMNYDYNLTMKKQLLATGIDITNGKIVNTADQWECQNNNGVKTAWLDNLGNFTVTGVYNNLVTYIDWDMNDGRELIITRFTETSDPTDVHFDMDTSSGIWRSEHGIWLYSPDNVKTYEVEWFLDVLRCGDFVRIESLPKYGGAGSVVKYNLPYYATEQIQMRGYTRFETGEIHLMSADELRMLVGRRMTFKITGTLIPASNKYYTHIGDVFELEPYHHNSWTDGLRYIANGDNFFIKPTSNNMNYVPCVPLVAHVEFKNTVWSTDQSGIDYNGYGYVWCFSKEITSPTFSSDDGLDSWT